ncbi:MAG: thioredoxin domain-containing protein [Candidatus Kerfeldbacteria bacterium]|nr:thioredoxin domain-containing protein [Candidatus Kerfeldbacteria bacterium]
MNEQPVTKVDAQKSPSLLSMLTPKIAYWLGIVTMLLVDLLVGFGILLWIVLSGSHLTTTDTTTGKTNSNTNTGGTVKTATADASKVTTTNDPVVGNADAKVTIAYWYDFQCPFCQRNEKDTISKILSNYVDTGKVKLVFKDFAFLGADSTTLGQYSRAVWDTAPDKYAEWHTVIFENQGQENSGWATQEVIEGLTKQVFDDATTAKIVDLVKTNGTTYLAEMTSDKTEGSSFGVTGTPAMIIGTQFINGAQGYAVAQAAIESALSGK